ncbi:GerMN domain-containing protein [Patescibacteria group bacterium]|nr:GerMN domain-containing protein [Patescibacteria group bacterium]
MIKKILFWLGILLVAGAISMFSIKFFGGEDSWICQKGQWVKRGNPSAPMPTSGCEAPAKKIEEKEVIDVQERYGKTQTNESRLHSPSANQVLTSPLKIAGELPSSWYFEANAVVKLYDADGVLLIASPMTAQSEWMEPNIYVPFAAEIFFNEPDTPTGTLVIINDNPSGLPENEKSEMYSVKFWPTVNVYFNSGTADICESVLSTSRFVRPTKAIARAALEELLKGPTDEEKQKTLFTSIPENVEIQSLTIEEGIAKVDFSKELEQGVGGSCRVIAIRSQIEKTLMQFDTVKKVVISIDGRINDILQP